MHFQKIGIGTPIVFLHGWGCDGSIFLPIAKKLNNFKSYLVDFNGFGKSPAPPQNGWGVEQYTEALKLFFKQHNLSNVCIVAHSFGCRVALVFAAKYPTLVQKMLLVAPAGIRQFSLRRWLKVRKYKLCKLFRPSVAAKFGSADYRACGDNMRNTFVKVINQDLSHFAKQVECPVLIVNGKSDAETPLKQARILNKLLKNSSLAEIDGDHFAFFKTPSAFAQAICYFMGANT